jgi:solute:Na+ symporter, SSS family
LVIFWMSFSTFLPINLQTTLHSNMIIVVGVVSIFLCGVLLTKAKALLSKSNK